MQRIIRARHYSDLAPVRSLLCNYEKGFSMASSGGLQVPAYVIVILNGSVTIFSRIALSATIFSLLCGSATISCSPKWILNGRAR
jgi:hypothetical protein